MYHQKLRLYLFATFLVLYEFTTYASNDMIMPGMINVVNQFNVSIELIATSLSIYVLGNCALQLILGPLAERYGKKKLIIIGNLTFLIFTLFIAMSNNITQFMLGRFLQGSAMAYIALGYSIIHENFNDTDSVKITSLMANIAILAPLVGPLIGALILSQTSWPHIFIISGIIGTISLIGLIKYTPQSSLSINHINIKEVTKTYINILKNKNFFHGVMCSSIAIIPGIAWIALAPTLIIETLHRSYMEYVIYSGFAISGLTISSLIMQFIAGRVSFYKIINRGNKIAFIGLCIAMLFTNNLMVLSAGLFTYMLGLGIFNGSIVRIILESQKYKKTMIVSLMVFVQTLMFGIGIEVINYLCKLANFSMSSYTIISFIIGCVTLILLDKFAKNNKSRQWE